MNYKKFSIYTVRDFIDNLIEKIPEKILRPIIHVMYAIAGLIILFGIYYGAKEGYASAKQEGQELGKDTKTLFQEEIERTHNRNNRSVVIPDTSSIYTESLHEIEKIFPSREPPEPPTTSTPDESLMKRDAEFKPKQELSGPPIEDISKSQRLPVSISKEDKFEIDSNLEAPNYYDRTLKETPNYNYRILERKPKGSFTPSTSSNSKNRLIPKSQKQERLFP